MQKIMFSDRYGLTQAVLEGRKTMTRRIITDVKVIQYLLEIEDDGALNDADPDVQCIIDYKAKYKVGEVVAVAQSYRQIEKEIEKEGLPPLNLKGTFLKSAGYNNKMFVCADLMPHLIRITNVRIERLQDISAEDCIKELVQSVSIPDGVRYFAGGQKINDTELNRILSGEVVLCEKCFFSSPQLAFEALIDATSGKGTWKNNPFVFVYEFELFK